MAELTTARQALLQCGLVPVDANALLAHATGKDRAWLVAHATDPLPQQVCELFFALAKRRRDGEPVAYLTGRREFRDLMLHVTADVLIPRPETEVLVEAALACVAIDAPARILDLGTGSGAIALALAHARPRADVIGVDIAQAAIGVATANADRLGIRNVRFLRANWFDGVGDARFNAIVANPPYVAAADAHLLEGDLRFEPRDALTPGGDGLSALRAIIDGAPDHLATDASLLLEHGYDQSQAVCEMLARCGYINVRRLRDLAGHWRVAAARIARPGQSMQSLS
ncbi:MAG: peptide chain release factor N(5)-glutamine methyltransferase [Casimicrobiaceae bacterium]